MFIKYPHIERLGSDEVQDILLGRCYVFPKIDGTNASVWLEAGVVRAGSHTREISTESDNAGFCAWAEKDDRIAHLLVQHPGWRVFGEWLVPHTLKTYRDDAWRKFYVFDVLDGDRFLTLEEYEPTLCEYGIEYIPALAIIENPTEEKLYSLLERNTFLIKDGAGVGEGIVIKRYDFVNLFGRTTWAKIVRNEFKERNQEAFGVKAVVMSGGVEQDIVDEYVTAGRIDKVLAKMRETEPFSSKRIPELLNRVWNDLITDEIWNVLKQYKNPTIDFRKLNQLCIRTIKERKPDLF